MRFRDYRQVLLKGIDSPNLPKLEEPTTPEQLSTPKFISPTHSGRLAAKMAGKKPPLTLPNRAYVRNATKTKHRAASSPPHLLAMTRELSGLPAFLREEKRWQRRYAHWLRTEQTLGKVA